MKSINPKDLGKVVVIYGGTSAEREVSLMSGAGVINALQQASVEVYGFDPQVDSLEHLLSKNFDRAFLILHGKGGEDGIIQGLMEYIRLPYTGPGVYTSAVGMDKLVTKQIWSDYGLPVPKGIVLKNKGDCEKALKELGPNLVIKPCKEGSSIGLYKLKNATLEETQEAFEKASKTGMSVLCEEFIFGRELTVALLDTLDGKGLHTLPIIEIKAPDGDYDFEHKYYSDETVYECPAQISKDIEDKVSQAVQKAALVLGTTGWSRVDVMLRPDGSFVLLEINTAPGMTPHSLVPLAAKTAGYSYEQLVLMLCAGATLKA